MRVLRYLPTNLSAPEIARELSVSVTTVRTHISHLFVKLGAHRRTEAVARARDLGLLAPSPMRRAGQPRATVLCPAHAAWRECRDDLADFGPSTPLGEPPRTLADWVGVPGFARLGGPTALGVASANTLTPVNSSQLYDADPSSRARRLEVSQQNRQEHQAATLIQRACPALAMHIVL
jgi:DNA-binding CsgD family transcriptional regulator